MNCRALRPGLISHWITALGCRLKCFLPSAIVLLRWDGRQRGLKRSELFFHAKLCFSGLHVVRRTASEKLILDWWTVVRFTNAWLTNRTGETNQRYEAGLLLRVRKVPPRFDVTGARISPLR